MADDRFLREPGGEPVHKSVLILGATGLIGNAVARQLVARGYAVTGTCRQRGRMPLNLKGLGIRTVHGDIDEPGNLDAWIEGHDVVVDAAAPYPLHLMYTEFGGGSNALDHAAKRTQTLIAGLRRHSARLVHVSTLLARPEKPGVGYSGLQKQLMRAIHPYFAIKSLIEQQLREAAATVPGIAVIQPSACLGPYDTKPRDQCLIPKVVCGELPVTVSHKVNVIDTRDVARGIVAVIEAESYGQTIRLTGHNTSVESLIAEISAISGVAGPRWRYPAEFGVLPSYWTEIMYAVVGRESPLPSLLPILICEQDWIGTAEEQEKLGIVPRPLGETIRDTVRWYRDLGYC